MTDEDALAQPSALLAPPAWTGPAGPVACGYPRPRGLAASLIDGSSARWDWGLHIFVLSDLGRPASESGDMSRDGGHEGGDRRGAC